MFGSLSPLSPNSKTDSSPANCPQCRRRSGPAGRHFGLDGLSPADDDVHQQQRNGVSDSLLPPMSISVSSQGLSSICSPPTLSRQFTQQEQQLTQSRQSCSGRPLTNRHNKSCDWLGPGTVKSFQPNALPQQDEVHVLTNPIAQVSSDILKASGYTHQFKKLLSSGTRTRPQDAATCERLPSTDAEGICKQQSLDAVTVKFENSWKEEGEGRGRRRLIRQKKTKSEKKSNRRRRSLIKQPQEIPSAVARNPDEVPLPRPSSALIRHFSTELLRPSDSLALHLHPLQPCASSPQMSTQFGADASTELRRFTVADVAETALRQRRVRRRDHEKFWRSFDKCVDFSYSLSRDPSSLKLRKLRDSRRRRTLSQHHQQIQQHCQGRRMADTATDERCNGELLQSSGGGFRGIVYGTAKSLEWNLADDGPSKRKTSTLQQQLAASATHRQVRRRQSGYGISITTESQAKMRCKMRKLYFVKRNKNCDFSLALAIVGLAFVVMDQELTANRWIGKQSAPSLLLRSFCVTSTLMLIVSLINYHRIEVKMALIDSGAEDWRVALTTDRIIKLFIEVAVCAVCPFPGSGEISWPYIHERRIATKTVPLDVLLSVPMFLRAYLLCRFMVLHSRQFQDAATRSIAALNRISMDFRFVIKTMMADHPMTVLIIFTVSYWICMSWMFTQCERYNESYTGSSEMVYSNSLWFIMVTFMSIGYGDVVPTSYCGRFLSISTGIVGAGVSSALIAVISRKLELSRAEKHVNNFMADSKLTNARKNAAASVLQHTWFIHKYQQRNGQKADELRLRQHQRKFLNAINDFRRIKWDQRKLQDKGNLLLDVGKLHTEMHETLWEMHRTQETFAGMIEVLTKRIVELQNTVVAVAQSQLQPGQAITTAAPSSNGAKANGQLKVPRSVEGDPSMHNQLLPTPEQFLSAVKLQPPHNDGYASPVCFGEPFSPLGTLTAASNLTLTNSCSSPCLRKPTINQQKEDQLNCTEFSPLMGEGTA
uniref:Calmodulin-binding domain-containing protein n=1 Tax=Globodera rostochiensis TaxID=31243 RepID=A0A914HGU5_GLORO